MRPTTPASGDAGGGAFESGVVIAQLKSMQRPRFRFTPEAGPLFVVVGKDPVTVSLFTDLADLLLQALAGCVPFYMQTKCALYIE